MLHMVELKSLFFFLEKGNIV
jgi:hypothetical protein